MLFGPQPNEKRRPVRGGRSARVPLEGGATGRQIALADGLGFCVRLRLVHLLFKKDALPAIKVDMVDLSKTRVLVVGP